MLRFSSVFKGSWSLVQGPVGNTTNAFHVVVLVVVVVGIFIDWRRIPVIVVVHDDMLVLITITVVVNAWDTTYPSTSLSR